jgi:hypothetical protein
MTTLQLVETTKAQASSRDFVEQDTSVNEENLGVFDSFARIDENPETFDELTPVCKPKAMLKEKVLSR